MKKQRIRYYDFLKGIAISMVILVHFTARIPGLNPVIAAVGQYGQMGCQLFFVISACFCIRGLENRDIPFGQYFKDKIMRLMPAYILAILIHLPVIIVLRDILRIDMNWPRTDIANIIANVFLLQHYCNFGDFSVVVTGSWFVAVLIVFYVLTYFGFRARIISAKCINLLIIVSAVFAVAGGVVLEKLTRGGANCKQFCMVCLNICTITGFTVRRKMVLYRKRSAYA